MPLSCAEPYGGTLSSQIDAPPRVVATLKPERMNALPDGSYVFDMGQNMVGWVALRVNGKAGTTVRLRFAEILNPDGTIYTTNLRNADATDTLHAPRGIGGNVQSEIHLSRLPLCGSERLSGEANPCRYNGRSGEQLERRTNRLHHDLERNGEQNVEDRNLGATREFPKCSRRIARSAMNAWVGWPMPQMFWRTGSYNFDIAAFTNKWMRDVDAQFPNGAFTNVSPNIGVSDVAKARRAGAMPG